jgi:hypothetical protein
MSFEKLVETLAAQEQTLAKSLQGAQDGQGAGGEAAGGAGASSAGSTSADQPLVKSFEFVLDDGTKITAQDASEVVDALQKRLDNTEAQLAKALTSMAMMVKSIGETVAAMGASGRGRRAVLSMPAATGADASTLALASGNANAGTVNREAVMAKALSFQTDGKLDAVQVAMVEEVLTSGSPQQQQALVKSMGL